MSAPIGSGLSAGAQQQLVVTVSELQKDLREALLARPVEGLGRGERQIGGGNCLRGEERRDAQ